ncbi:hypothetical protein JW968_00160 [Candidatus Woesearchaeota archaeon]|nr:hypothetical protein [Candidatus Woesearchaeota archaeon]
MVTIAHIAKKLIEDKPFLLDALAKKIINYGALADMIQPDVEKEMGKKVKHSAVMMAIRRYADALDKVDAAQKFDYNSEIIMKTNLCDIAVSKSPSLFIKLKKIYETVNYEKGDQLNVIHGNNEVSIIISSKYLEKISKILEGERILNTEKDLVSLSLSYGMDFYRTPGIIYHVTKLFAWENINIIEIVSTLTELTFIISNKDSMRAYNALQKLITSKR